jgi:predicted PurR-regulated permease PerM
MDELPIADRDTQMRREHQDFTTIRDAAASGVDARAVAVSVLAGVGALYAIREGAALLAPLLLGVLLAYALEPFVALAARCRLPRPVAVVIVCALSGGTLAGAGLLAQRQIAAFIDTLPATVGDLQRSIARAREKTQTSDRAGPIEHLQQAATDLEAAIAASSPRPQGGIARVLPQDPPFNVRGYLAGASVAVGAAGARLLAIALLTFLLLLTGETLKRKLIAIAGPLVSSRCSREICSRRG